MYTEHQPLGDIAETKAIKEAEICIQLKYQKIKSMTGHLLGAAGAIEALLVLKLHNMILSSNN